MSVIPSPYGALSSEVASAMHDLNRVDEEVLLGGDARLLEPSREAEELFQLPDGVQIFFIKPDGTVSTFSAPSTLRIFKFRQQLGVESETPTFIQVGGWTHPLIPGASPVLEAANGAFMFPDVYSSESGSSVGIVLAPEVPSNIRDQLRELLDTYTALKSQTLLPEDQRLGTIGKTLVKGAEYVNKGLDYGSKRACELIEYVGEQQRTKLIPAETDTKVGATFKYSAKGALYATHATVKVSGFVANRVGKLTKGVSNYLASKIEKPMTGAVVSQSGGPPKSSSMRSLFDAARGGLIAYGTVYAGLEDSAKSLGTCVKSQSVRVVEHKYGQEAGVVYGDAMTAAGNAAMTYMNVTSLGVKGLVKRTAKDTGKAVGKAVINAHVEKKVKVDDGSAVASQ
ncbi:spartin-like [Tigriopus californicus]|uniref:spartin-like n=1 Tax=Tigriopus californicus TaxID=6832 RepID=UPI0027DA0BFA|nr:spartin-like [Tigriopus californicus]